MWSMRKMLAIIGIVALVGTEAYAGVRLHKRWHYPEWHARVSVGDTEEAVGTKMGSPDWVHQDPDAFWCGRPRAARMWLYGGSIPPDWYLVGFGTDRKLACAEHFVSP